MQFVFYMTPQEERGIIDFVLSKGGYFMPGLWETYPPPVLSEAFSPAAGMSDPFRELMIFKEELFPSERAISQEWELYWKPGKRFMMKTRPGFEYTRPCVQGDMLLPGRFYFGGTALSFLPPGEMAAAITDEHRQAEKRLQNFYRACCNRLRKSMARHLPGWYIGADVDAYCAQAGLRRAPATNIRIEA